MNCSNCGMALQENSDFCSNCGAMNASQKTDLYNQQSPYHQAPPYQAPPYQPTPYQGVPEQKSKLVAGLLQIFLSGFAVGRFYLGYTNLALVQLLVSIFTCGMGALWPLIDGIMILTGSVQVDGKGIPLKD
ncbi:MAG: TM2 domain-containing protein [Peptococcaceae bacterium]|nr:TM2 domain-containing protein [Peptococcaceae bacterium]